MNWLEDKFHLTQVEKTELGNRIQDLKEVADNAAKEGKSPSEAIIKKTKEILYEANSFKAAANEVKARQ